MRDNLDLPWFTVRREYGGVSYAYTGNETPGNGDDDDDDDDGGGGGRGGG